ncbi:MAG: hypothetical protein LC623_02365, partial [Halobacteriales archaeon]|nr:hypothetical protein [Halobacteriales archaeon]
PIAIAAGQPVAYWNILTPSFVYVPWYAADPPHTTPTSTGPPQSHTSGPSNGGSDGSTASTSPTKKKSPGVEVPLAIVGLAALVLVARRKLH